MNNIWVATDWHLWNYKIQDDRHKLRSISNIGKLADHYTSDIDDTDLFIHLGDICDPGVTDIHKLQSIIKSIPGYKVLCKGNHDTQDDSFYYEIGFDVVCDVCIVYNLVFSHKPLRIPPDMINIHGHLHTRKLSTLGNQHINAYDTNFYNHPVLVEKLLQHAIYQRPEEYADTKLNHVEEKFDKYTSLEYDTYENIVDLSDRIAIYPVDESSQSNEPAADSPDELSEWMRKNIQYKEFTKLMSHDEVLKEKQGSCHDQVVFEYYYLKHMVKNLKILFFIAYRDGSNEGGMTHSLIYYPDGEYIIWFENAWDGCKGIHRYKNLNELKSDILHKYSKMPDAKEFPKLQFKNISINRYKPGSDLNSFVSGIMNESVSADSGKKILNDEGKEVPKVCPKCGAPVKVYLQGEPVYLCSNKECKQYFGVVPCNETSNENILDEILFSDVDDTKYFESDDDEYMESRYNKPTHKIQTDKNAVIAENAKGKEKVGTLTVNNKQLDIYRKISENPNDPVDKEAHDLSFYIGSEKLADISISAVNSNKAFLYNFEVKSKYRGNGYGSAILKYILQQYRVNELTVAKDNEKAIKLYKRFGFKIGKSFKENNRDMVDMKINLNESALSESNNKFSDVKRIVDRIPKEEHHWFYHGNTFKDSPYVKYRDVMYLSNGRGKTIGGFIDVYSFDDEPEIGIIVIAVEPEARGTGLATKLVKKALKQLPSLGFKKLIWRADTDNIASVKLAQKMGFTDVSDLKKNPDQYKYQYILNEMAYEDYGDHYLTLFKSLAHRLNQDDKLKKKIAKFSNIDIDKVPKYTCDIVYINTNQLCYSMIEDRENVPFEVRCEMEAPLSKYCNELMKDQTDRKEYPCTNGIFTCDADCLIYVNMNFDDINEAFNESQFNKIIELNRTLNTYQYGLSRHGEKIKKQNTTGEDYDIYYRAASPKQFIYQNGGICWDFVTYEAYAFSTMFKDIKYKTYYVAFDIPPYYPSHTFLIFEYNNKYYYFESSFRKYQGIYEANSPIDIINFILYNMSTYNNNSDTKKIKVAVSKNDYTLLEYDALHPSIPGSTTTEYMKLVEEIGKPITHKYNQVFNVTKIPMQRMNEMYLSSLSAEIVSPEEEDKKKDVLNGDAVELHTYSKEDKEAVYKKYGVRSGYNNYDEQDSPEKREEARHKKRLEDLKKARKVKARKATVRKIKSHIPGIKNEDTAVDDADVIEYEEPTHTNDRLWGDQVRLNQNRWDTEDISHKQINETYQFHMMEKIYFNDFINESQEVNPNEKLYPVYVVLMHSGTALANVIKTVTKSNFSHSSISFDSSLRNMYSFGRKEDTNPFIGAFKKEDIRSDFFKNREVPYALYVVPCTKQQVDMMKKRLDYFIQNSTKFKYDFTGLFKNYFGIADNPEYKWFCSRFVSDILNAGRPQDPYIMEPSLMKPEDFTDTTFATYVTGGTLSMYDQASVDKKTQVILRAEKMMRMKNAALNRQHAANESSGIFDIDYRNPYQTLTLQYQLAVTNESAIDNFIQYLQSFKIRFDKNGNVIISRREYDQLDQHFRQSLRMIRAYEKSGDIESVKYELAKINYMINLINKYYLSSSVKNSNQTKQDIKKYMMDLRSVMLNAFRQHLQFVMIHEPQFNFQSYYEHSKYGNNTEIPQSVVTMIGKTIMTAL